MGITNPNRAKDDAPLQLLLLFIPLAGLTYDGDVWAEYVEQAGLCVAMVLIANPRRGGLEGQAGEANKRNTRQECHHRHAYY